MCHNSRFCFIKLLILNFRFDRKEAELLSALNRLEVERETDTSTLFRADNLTTSIMERYMKSVCTDFLQTAIHPTIHRLVTIITYSILKILPYKMCHDITQPHFRILESRHQSCELNPNKIESTQEQCNNAEFLLQVLDDITESIFMSSEACPRTLRYTQCKNLSK